MDTHGEVATARDEDDANYERYRATRRATLVGATVNVLLSIAQVTFGILGQSQALIVDGVHTLSDLLSDSVVLIAARFAHRRADEDHPYGHGRFETVATVALGLLLLTVATGIGWDSVQRLLEPQRLVHPTPLALAAACIGIVAKEALYQYTRRVARRIRSAILEANAWHHRSDVLSSVIVFLGIAGALAGFDSLDAVAAIGVAGMIAWIAVQLVLKSVRELVDTALEPETVATIRDRILAVEGVESLHVLRTRRLGPDVLVDVHIIVDPRLTVSEGHYISESVRAKVMAVFREVNDVLVHIDPEDDETAVLSRDLPSRNSMLRELRSRWSAQPIVENISLHYLDGRVDVDVILPLDALRESPDASGLRSQFARAAAGVRGLGRVELYFH